MNELEILEYKIENILNSNKTNIQYQKYCLSQILLLDYLYLNNHFYNKNLKLQRKFIKLIFLDNLILRILYLEKHYQEIPQHIRQDNLYELFLRTDYKNSFYIDNVESKDIIINNCYNYKNEWNMLFKKQQILSFSRFKLIDDIKQIICEYIKNPHYITMLRSNDISYYKYPLIKFNS